MNDADELARRYLTLWTQYLTALLADPRAMEMLKRWMEVAGRFSYPASDPAQPGGAPFPAWPPFFGPFGPPPIPNAPAADADEIARLARRVDELERRLAVLESRPKPRRAPRRTRRSGES
ncbi:MAG TPA: hypothetical protein VMI30_12565 [Stellaceae bacterium]|nr:hypothetical protein [Stellaceae bacterium]